MTNAATRAPVKPDSLQTRLEAARVQEDAGDLAGALAVYEALAAEARDQGAERLAALATRHAAIVHHRRGDPDRAKTLLFTALAGARSLNDTRLVSEILNTAGVFALERGEPRSARAHLLDARALSAGHQDLRARIEQNLGALASMQGDDAGVLAHSTAAIQAFEACGDQRGSAKVYHNLAMRCADRGEWDEADRHYGAALEIARRTEDAQLVGLCLLNQADAAQASGRTTDALALADSAAAHFERLGTLADRAEARRVRGAILRAHDRLAEAEVELLEGLALARRAKAGLTEAEIQEELARVHERSGRIAEARVLYEQAARSFDWLEVADACERVRQRLAGLGEPRIKSVALG